MRTVRGMLWCWVILWNCVSKAQETKTEFGKVDKLKTSLLPNLIAVREGVYSGGQPNGDAAFQELSKLGVRTLISVDGARPDVQAAEKYGMRYVHLPHGYDGVPQQRAKELAQALQTLDGPFYIHCHHGKHRSPAAAAVACRSLGWLEPSEALQLLTIAGTDPRYQGLYRSVTSAKPIAESELEKIPTDFPSVAQLPPMAQVMVELEEHFSRLKALERQRWVMANTQAQSVQDALLLFEHFRELPRIEDPRSTGSEFIRLTRASEEAALTIQRELSSSSTHTNDSIMKLDQAMTVVEANCKACHQHVRN